MIFKVEEINGLGRCPTYLYRYHILHTRWFKIYLHKFVGNDWSRDLHDHPKRFISIGLKGRYIEETPQGTKLYKAPWLRTFPATHIHRLTMFPDEICWTLIIVSKLQREWGFYPSGVWTVWHKYINSPEANKAKDCG